MSFALSTSWNAFRHDNGKELLREIKQAGFQEIELSFNLTVSIVEEIEQLAREKQISVVSVHNFCPVPEGVKRQIALPDYYAMSSLNEEERATSVRYSKITIDTAARLGARAVVLHCGRVDIEDKTRFLGQLYSQGLKDSKEFLAIKDAFLAQRQKKHKPYLENTLKSLEELISYAGRKKIALGIENRFYHREIPSLEEVGIILDTFKDGGIFYWHDTGHAQLMEYLGFSKHIQYLQLYGHKMAGVHLHNITGCDDHKAPSKGEIDFIILKPYIKKDTIKVIEAHEPASESELKESVRFLEEVLNVKG